MIEMKEGKPKVENPVERVQKELKMIKIVNNRENLWKEKVTDTHYVNRERESRYGRWKNEMEHKGYKRSNSKIWILEEWICSVITEVCKR